MNQTTRTIVVTGADGYLGLRVVKRLLASGDAPLALWIRSSDRSELEKKEAAMSAALGFNLGDKRISIHCSDLTREDCFWSIDAASVGAIVHCAAVTRFNVDAETARAVNIQGTSRLISFARRCPQLERLCYVSTIYASGLKEGTVSEEPIDESVGFANHYERSKWSAERQLIDGEAGLPWSIVRVATVLANDASGYVAQYNAVHNTLKLMFYGLMSVLPGNASTPLYLVTGDFAADAVVAAVERGQSQAIYHASYTKDECITLGRFVDLAYETFETDASFKKRRILKPLYTDLSSFTLLSDAATGFGDGIMKQALSSVSPFARQLFIEKDVENKKLRQILAGYAAPEPEAFVRNTCSYLVETKWGRAAEVAVS